MAISDSEVKMYSDIVTAVNRTDKQLEFLYDSKLYVIPANGKKHMPRFIAEHGIKQHTTRYGMGGLPTESLIGIENDKLWVTDKIAPEEVKELVEGDKFGDEIEVKGKPGRKKKINLRPQMQNFAGNNG